MNEPGRQTALHAAHLAANARMVEFAGWHMPLHYGSQIEEHLAVRRDAGVFDISHMLTLELSGMSSTPFLRHLLANDVAKLDDPGKAQYSCMLNEHGSIIDDLIIYRLSETEFRMVVNAGTADSDVAWIRSRIAATSANVTLNSRREISMIAVQGPTAIERARKAIPELNTSRGTPPVFRGVRLGDLFVARTGYTGEDGLEIAAPTHRIRAIWDKLLEQGVPPCGLGARDSLRLEAGLLLYGEDMDDTTHPIEAGVGWTIDLKDFERQFIGKTALLDHEPNKQTLGLVLLEKGMLRGHMRVNTSKGAGRITSGSYSPCMNISIAFARLPLAVVPGDEVEVDVRGKPLKARVVKPPFVRHGKVLV